MAVQDRDLGMKRIIAEMQKASRLEVAVGIQQGAKGAEGASIAEYGAYNEFGTGKIPSRPFMATSFDESRAQIDQDFDREASAMMQGKSAHQALLTIGLKHAQRIQKTISGRNFLPKLAERTVRAKKGSTKTLVDTGAMLNSIHPVVRGRS
jgi:hypothetical protein